MSATRSNLTVYPFFLIPFSPFSLIPSPQRFRHFTGLMIIYPHHIVMINHNFSRFPLQKSHIGAFHPSPPPLVIISPSHVYPPSPTHLSIPLLSIYHHRGPLFEHLAPHTPCRTLDPRPRSPPCKVLEKEQKRSVSIPSRFR